MVMGNLLNLPINFQIFRGMHSSIWQCLMIKN